ncbi:SDR family NAD(P)-dependent oxidoreductase [Kitasatospora sp. NPDC088391]|uniref:SDR family NAD(P)-dependent oxidoreductase n=1 Tax=Kitasatospora sp. NPDC088391 TaxID=3364074 RepID=UPI0037F3AF38
MNPRPLVAVTGGTGFLGAHTVAALAAAGARVRLLVRDPDRLAPALGPLGLDPDTVRTVPGDVTDPAAAARLCAGADAVVHLGSVYSFDRRRRTDIARTNVQGTETVLRAAVRSGAGAVVHVSTVGALIPATDPELRTDSPVGRPAEPYLASKAAGELLARQLQREGAPVRIAYPPALIGPPLGPDDRRLGDQNGRLRDTLRGLMPLWPTGGFPLGDVRDAAAVLARLATAADAPARAFTPSRFLGTADYLAELRAATGRALPAARLPGRAMLPAARLADLLQRHWPWHVPAEYGAAYTCVHARPVAADPGGPEPRPVGRTMAETVHWLYGAGLLTYRQAGTAATP